MSTIKKALLLATPMVPLCGWFAYDYVLTNLKFIPTTAEERAAIRAEVAAQDEAAFYKPAQSPRSILPANPLNNVYFGDLHIHSNLSADAYLFGNRRDLDATYRFAKGESALIETGEIIEITRPMDFAAVTDHAEGLDVSWRGLTPQRQRLRRAVSWSTAPIYCRLWSSEPMLKTDPWWKTSAILVTTKRWSVGITLIRGRQ